MQWKKGQFEGRKTWQGETDALQITLVPELGSKVISLFDKRSGREWLWRGSTPLGNRGYDSPFEESDTSGWDEMFPSIDACLYPNFPWAGTPIPDHGELWCVPWSSELIGNQLHLSAHGIRFPYRLEKTYTFPKPNLLWIDYSLTNLSPYPFSFIWAAHPLFRISQNLVLRVPSDLNQIVISNSTDPRLGPFGSIHPWPEAVRGEKPLRLDRMGSPQDQEAYKFYFRNRVTIGKASLLDEKTGEELVVHFPAERVPYLAIWANFGGYKGEYNLAIEPATGFMDRIDYAAECDELSVVQPYAKYNWYLSLEFMRNENGT